MCKSPPPLSVQRCSFHSVICLSLLDVIQHPPPLPSTCVIKISDLLNIEINIKIRNIKKKGSAEVAL